MDRYAIRHNISRLSHWIGLDDIVPDQKYLMSVINKERSCLAVMEAEEYGASEHGLYSDEYDSKSGAECLRISRYECENSLFPCLIVDPRPCLKIAAANGAAATELCRPSEELVGRPIYELTPEPAAMEADGISKLLTSFGTVMATRAGHGVSGTRFAVQPPDGGYEEHYMRIQNTPILDSRGDVLFIRCELFKIKCAAERHPASL